MKVGKEMRERLIRACEEDGRPMSNWVGRLIERELARLDRERAAGAGVLMEELRKPV